MSDLVGNPEDRFSRVEARIIDCKCIIIELDCLSTWLSVQTFMGHTRTGPSPMDTVTSNMKQLGHTQ